MNAYFLLFSKIETKMYFNPHAFTLMLPLPVCFYNEVPLPVCFNTEVPLYLYASIMMFPLLVYFNTKLPFVCFYNEVPFTCMLFP